MQAQQKRKMLIQAIELLGEADALVQEALGATDACYDLHCALQDIADELEEEVVAEIG